MSTPLHAEIRGTFTTPATLVPVNISLPSGYDYIELINVTDFNTPAASIVKAEGYASAVAGSAVTYTGDGATPNVLTARVAITGGFTFVSDSGNAALGAAVAITAITAATPAVASSASTVVAGDVVRVYGTTAMLQVSGMDFTVTAVNPGVTQNFGFIPAAGFAAAATAGFMMKVPFDPRFYPRRRFVTAISQAASAVIQLSVLHDFHVGEKVRIIVPSEYGMTQMNNRLATITAIAHTLGTGTNTITVDVDSTAFTAFAFPTSAVAASGVSFPQVVPVGEAATGAYASLLDDATLNSSFSGVQIDTGILVASCDYSYIARKGVTV
jgi:hypothetical protein